MKTSIFFIFLLLLTFDISLAQNEILDLQSALTSDTNIEEDLQELCDGIGGRVTGSPANERSVEWGINKFKEAGVRAWKHSFQMPVLWLEESCSGHIMSEESDFEIRVVSKYKTPPGNYRGELVILDNLDSSYLEERSHLIKDNFILVPSELCLDINGLFAEYIQATNIENTGRKYNAQGVVFMSSRPRKLLYRYITSKGVDNDFPQFVMSREDAKRCIRLSENGQISDIEIQISATTGSAFKSENVIAEITGSKHPEEVIIIGAHLDSWSLGTGANDNGCNVSMLIDIARQMKQLNIIPKRTIRFALWNGEEQGYFGSWAYTRDYADALDDHVMAISIDIGSGGIIGFFTNGREALVPMVDKLLKPVENLGPFNQINVPIIGTDNFDFMLEGVPNLVGAHKPASYGINYHASSDTYDKVDIKSLKNNAAIVATLLLGLANDDEKLERHNRSEIEQMIEKTNVEFPMRMFNVWDSWVSGDRGRKK